MLRRRQMACLLGALVLVATAGCEGATASDDKPSLPSAASKESDTEVWDLRQRPTAEQVGIGADEDTSVYEIRPSRPVRLRLAGGATVDLPARYLAYSTILSRDGKVVSLDLKTATMPREEVGARLESVLEQLELPIDAVRDFERQAEQATGSDRVTSDRVSGKFGALDLGVVARYSPQSKRGSVALVGNWLQDG